MPKKHDKKNQDVSLSPSVPIRVEVKRGQHEILIPTGDYHHMPKIREGSISGEVFTRSPSRRRELGLPAIPDSDSFLIKELRA